jgi:hypothetical protein
LIPIRPGNGRDAPQHGQRQGQAKDKSGHEFAPRLKSLQLIPSPWSLS